MKFERLDRIITDSQDMIVCSQCEQVRAAEILLRAAEKKRDMLREEIETNPRHSPDELEKDVDFLLGMIKGLNWVLGLPERSREFINKLK